MEHKELLTRKQHAKKDLHIRLEPELYEKIRHISFYERRSMTELINRLLREYVEEKADVQPENVIPLVL